MRQSPNLTIISTLYGLTPNPDALPESPQAAQPPGSNPGKNTIERILPLV